MEIMVAILWYAWVIVDCYLSSTEGLWDCCLYVGCHGNTQQARIETMSQVGEAMPHLNQVLLFSAINVFAANPRVSPLPPIVGQLPQKDNTYGTHMQ